MNQRILKSAALGAAVLSVTHFVAHSMGFGPGPVTLVVFAGYMAVRVFIDK